MAKKKNDEVQYPVAVDGRYVCSDGKEYSDMYFARLHEESINQIKNNE